MAGGISWKHSGRVVGNAGPQAGFAADNPAALLVTTLLPGGPSIQYPRGTPTANVKLNVFVNFNNFAFNPGRPLLTSFTVYKNGVATALALSFAGAELGYKSAIMAIPFAAGDRYDLRIDQPAAGVDVGNIIRFGASADFF